MAHSQSYGLPLCPRAISVSQLTMLIAMRQRARR
jgi:hypothetical protein